MISPNLLMMGKSDTELIRLVKNDADNEAILEVCRRYENIFYKICQRYSSSLTKVGIDVNDIFDEKYYIIFYCICSFKPSKKTKLSTWIGNYARYLCLNAINSKKFILPSSDEEIKQKIEETQCKNVFLKNEDKQGEYSFILNILSQLKDPRIYNVFNLRYSHLPNKMIWSRIASSLGLSTQTAINLHNKGLRILKTKIKSKDFCDFI